MVGVYEVYGVMEGLQNEMVCTLHRTLPVPPFHFFDVTDRTLPVPPFHFFDVTDRTLPVPPFHFFDVTDQPLRIHQPLPAKQI